MTGDESSPYMSAAAYQAIAASSFTPTIAIIGGDGAPLAKIYPDGRLEYGAGYDPDDAARAFWEAMRYHMPTRCPNCGRVGLLEGS